MRIFVLFSLLGCLLFIGCGEKSSDNITLPLSDADVEQLLKEAVDVDSLEERGDLRCQVNESEPYSGWAKKLYESGQVRVLFQFKDGKFDGPYNAWHENGQKSVEATFKDGEPVGLMTQWYENGQKKEESIYKNGKEDGLRTQWHENGQKEDETTFKDGKEDGLRTQWHENGQKWLEKTFEDGVWLGGSEKYWNSKGEEVKTRKEAQGLESTGENPMAPNQTGEPSADTAKPTPAESPSEEPSETPKSLSDVDVERLIKEAIDIELTDERAGEDGVLDGLTYLPNESEPYSGWIKQMSESGQVWLLAQNKSGKQHGLTISLHKNGQRSGEGMFKNDKKDGLWTRWYENGQKEREGTYKDDKQDGLHTEWHENGQKRSERNYKGGRSHGFYALWHESGQKCLEGTWEHGKKLSVKYWNRKGEEVETSQEALHRGG